MKIKKVYLGIQQIRPGHQEVTNYFPEMNSNTQDGFTATASTLYSGYYPYYAFYNYTGTTTPEKVFHSTQIRAGNTAYSMIQCPNSIQPTKIRIASRKADMSVNQRPIRAFTLQGSNDGTSFTDIITETGLASSRGSYTTSNVLEWSIPNSSKYTYLKLVVTANSDYVAFNYWNIDGII